MAIKPASNQDTTARRGVSGIYIRVPQDLKKRLKLYVANGDKSMQDVVIALIEQALPKTS